MVAREIARGGSPVVAQEFAPPRAKQKIEPAVATRVVWESNPGAAQKNKPNIALESAPMAPMGVQIHIEESAESMAARARGISSELIKKYEGFRSEKYICAGGKPTIGWGHVIKKDEVEQFLNREATDLECENLLFSDMSLSERGVARMVKVDLSIYEFAALVSFTFNLGVGALQRSTLLRKLNRGDKIGAADQFPRWNMAGGKVLLGLQRRRWAERLVFLGREVQESIYEAREKY